LAPENYPNPRSQPKRKPVSMKISSFALTDVGKVRFVNEDAFLLDDDLHVYAVADGLGGLPEGALASNLAVRYLQETLRNQTSNSTPDYEKVFHFINQKVFEKGRKISDETGIGTTLTVVKLNEEEMTIGHVGDSSVFLFRADSCQQLTTDHTMEQEVIDRLGAGASIDAPAFYAHTLTRCIGQEDTLVTEILHQKLMIGDRILVCSDGISKTLSADELLRELQATATPEEFLHAVIQLVNDHGGPDNSTGIAIFID